MLFYVQKGKKQNLGFEPAAIRHSDRFFPAAPYGNLKDPTFLTPIIPLSSTFYVQTMLFYARNTDYSNGLYIYCTYIRML